MLTSMIHNFEILIYPHLPKACGIEKQISKEQGAKVLLVHTQDNARPEKK